MEGKAYHVPFTGSSRRPNCRSEPVGENCHHCTALRVGAPTGRKIVCVHQRLPFRYTTFRMRASSVSIFLVVPSSGAEPSATGSKGSLKSQPLVGVRKAVPSVNISAPMLPVIVLTRSVELGPLRS